MKPIRRPANPCFSSGPCAKRPGWSAAALAAALVGRSHRSAAGLARLVEVVDRSRAILGVPSDWRVGIVAPSLGARFLWSGFVRELFRAGQFLRELTETGDIRHLIAVGHVADVIEVGNPRDLIVADVGDPIGVEKIVDIRRRGRALTLSVCDFAPQIGSW